MTMPAAAVTSAMRAATRHGMSCRRGLPDLRNEPFVVLSPSSSVGFFDPLVQTCTAAGFSPRIVQKVNELLTVHFLVQAGAGVSLVPSSASRMRVPSIRLLDTHLAEAKWKIGLTWRKRDQSAPLSAISLVLQVDSAMPPRECSRLKTLGDVLSEIGLDFCELLLR
jgi:DNA-binding transcriptional LysR family regulator